MLFNQCRFCHLISNPYERFKKERERHKVTAGKMPTYCAAEQADLSPPKNKEIKQHKAHRFDRYAHAFYFLDKTT
jgi:hypothetical protein